jgi:hypothetical protein
MIKELDMFKTFNGRKAFIAGAVEEAALKAGFKPLSYNRKKNEFLFERNDCAAVLEARIWKAGIRFNLHKEGNGKTVRRADRANREATEMIFTADGEWRDAVFHALYYYRRIADNAILASEKALPDPPEVVYFPEIGG